MAVYSERSHESPLPNNIETPHPTTTQGSGFHDRNWEIRSPVFYCSNQKRFPGWDEDAIRESYKAHGLDLDLFLQHARDEMLASARYPPAFDLTAEPQGTDLLELHLPDSNLTMRIWGFEALATAQLVVLDITRYGQRLDENEICSNSIRMIAVDGANGYELSSIDKRMSGTPLARDAWKGRRSTVFLVAAGTLLLVHYLNQEAKVRIPKKEREDVLIFGRQ